MKDIKLLKIMSKYGTDSYISFDLSLARGLDYYTEPLIYEGHCCRSPPKDAQEKKEQALMVKGLLQEELQTLVKKTDASAYVGVVLLLLVVDTIT